MFQVRTWSCTWSCEERMLEEAELSKGWSIFLLHCGSQSDLHAISDEFGGPPCEKACHTDESQCERALQDHSIIITVIETTTTPAGKLMKDSTKGQDVQICAQRGPLAPSSFQSVLVQHLDEIAQAMSWKMLHIYLGELEVKLSTHGAKKASRTLSKPVSEQAWNIHSRRRI